MPFTTAISRRDVRGEDPVEDVQPRTVQPAAPEKRDTATDTSMAFRQTVDDNLPEDLKLQSIKQIAAAAAQSIDPANAMLPSQVATYLTQLYSAQFGLQLISSGFPLNYSCTAVRDPSVALSLSQSNLDPVQIADLLCYVATYGWSLSVSANYLLGQVQTGITSLSAGSISSSSNLAASCGSLDLSDGSYIGVDGSGVQSAVCSEIITSTSVSGFTSGFTSTFASTEAGTAFTTGITLGTVGGSSLVVTATGQFDNGTAGAATITGTGATGTGLSGTGAFSGNGSVFTTLITGNGFTATGVWTANASSFSGAAGTGFSISNGSETITGGFGTNASATITGGASATINGSAVGGASATITGAGSGGGAYGITFFGSPVTISEVWSNGAAATFTAAASNGYEWSGSGSAGAISGGWTGAAETITEFTVIGGASGVVSGGAFGATSGAATGVITGAASGATSAAASGVTSAAGSGIISGAAFSGSAYDGEVVTFTGIAEGASGASGTSGAAAAGGYYEWTIVATAHATGAVVSASQVNINGTALVTGPGPVNFTGSLPPATGSFGPAPTFTIVGSNGTAATLTGTGASGTMTGLPGIGWNGTGGANGTGFATGSGWASGSGWVTAWSGSGTAVSSEWILPTGPLSYPQWTTSTTSNTAMQ